MIGGYGADMVHGDAACQPPHRNLFLAPEQCVGRIAVRRRLVLMSGNPRDLGFEQDDAFVELGNGVGGQILGGELARGIAPGARTIVVFHALVISQFATVAVNGTARYCTAPWH